MKLAGSSTTNLDELLEHSALDHAPLVQPPGHVIKINDGSDIFSELFDQSDVHVRLEESGADLLEHSIQHLEKWKRGESLVMRGDHILMDSRALPPR